MRAMVLACGLALVTAPLAVADPGAPQVGSDCAGELDGALTQLADGETFLACRDGSWQAFDGPYPASDKWFSYGPAVKLHGQGMRNPEILSGDWVATPQDSGSACSAEQAAVVSAGQVGPPQTSTGKPGQPLNFEVLPVVFSIGLSGNCLWERVT